ncbi:hypothetical protein CF319_g7746 [Tilletia indica]|nr:hypothetical protein CF319_g7746 [Tilletia indica]KAE8231350.1 hypothetical protein CF326_g3641 [Tilletia indica]
MGTSTGGISLYDLRMIRPYQSIQSPRIPSAHQIADPTREQYRMRKRSAAVAPNASIGPSDVGNIVLSAVAKSFKVWHSETGENAATISPPSSQS